MTVSKTEYWPAILADPTQLGQVKTTDDEFNKRAENIFKVLEDSLINGENKIYLQQWEAELELDAPENATLNDRKAAILYRITCELPSKIDIFQKSLELMLGAGNYEFEHLQDENKLVIHTDRITEQESQAVTYLIKRIIPKYLNVERYNHHIDISWRDINKYAACKKRDDVLAVNPDYLTDLTTDGEWVYPMPEMTRFDYVGNWWLGFFYGSKLKKIKAVFPKCTYSQALIGAVTTIEEVDLEFPIATHVQATCRYSDNYKKVRIIAPNATNFSYNTMGSGKKFVECEYYAPKATDLTNLCSEAMVLEEVKGEFGAEATTLTSLYNTCRKLRKFPTYYPKASTAANMFANCEIPGEAAIAVLNSFPAYTSGSHPVTMGIHVDHQNDPDVLAAIENAEAKGWTVTVQWNGTATAAAAAATWGMRRPPIYAKLAEVETPDGGTEKVLDWGHYATNAEENGYKEFASVEEAKAYFNITD